LQKKRRRKKGEKAYFVHRIDFIGAAIINGDRIVFVGPNGGNRSVATLSNHTA
jgi:deoxycytidylate deaminase